MQATETLFHLSSKPAPFPKQPVKPFLLGIRQLIKEIHASFQSREQVEKTSRLETRAAVQTHSKEEIKTPKAFFQERQREDKDKERRHKNPYQEDFSDESLPQEKKKKINAIEGSNASLFSHSSPLARDESSEFQTKPPLTPPKEGIFSVYYLLDKLGIYSEAASYQQAKEDLEITQAERAEAHKQMLDAMKKGMEKEKQSNRWSVATKVFSWMTSLTAIFAGISMIMTGVGAIGGAILIAGGIVAIGNQLMEVTRGWEKVAEILPGDDEEKKRAVVTWMQLGVAVFSLILAGAGVIFGGGYSVYTQASQLGSSLMGCISTMGAGVCEIGKGVETYHFKNSVAISRLWQTRLDGARFKHSDLLEMMDEAPDRLLHYFESFARVLGFVKEINRAHQRAWR